MPIPELSRDLAGRVLHHCTVPDRLRAVRLSSVWRSAGDDLSSWAVCDFGPRNNERGWAPETVARAIARAGPGLESLLRVNIDTAPGNIPGIVLAALENLRHCHQLKELDVAHCKFAARSIMYNVVTFRTLRDCLPPPPFKLQRLWLPPCELESQWESPISLANGEYLRQRYVELIGRSNWVNVHECDHCGNVFGIAAKDFTEAELFKEHTRDYALVPCEGSGCEGGGARKVINNDNDHNM